MSEEEFDDDLDLSTLPVDELVEQMHDDLYDGLRDEIVEGTKILLERGWAATKVLDDALVEGMRIVGIDFRDGILFVPEVLMSANAMKGGMEILRPLLAETGAEPISKMVIGTVKGDIHAIGKSLVATMLTANGFRVFDVGVDVPPETFITRVKETGANFLGLSALLTTTMVAQREVIKAFEEAGIRSQVKIMVGGAPVTKSWADEIGADGYSEDAMGAVRLAQELSEE